MLVFTVKEQKSKTNHSSMRRYRKWIEWMINLFRQGLSPHELSLSIALGILIGVLPIIGIQTILISAIAIYLRLNVPIAVFMTYVASPLFILLFIPFIRIGEWLFSMPPSPLTFDSIVAAFEANYFLAMADLLYQLGCGLAGWVFAGVPGAVLLYYLLFLVLRVFIKNEGKS